MRLGLQVGCGFRPAVLAQSAQTVPPGRRLPLFPFGFIDQPIAGQRREESDKLLAHRGHP